MTEILTASRQTWAKIADTVRRRGGKNDPLPPNAGMIGQGAPSWYWGELLTNVAAGSWTSPQRGYAKIMVPDRASVDDPQHFKELGTGSVTAIAGNVATSASHGLTRGKPIWITGSPDGTFWQVGNVTTDTFQLVGSGTPPIVGAIWHIALPWTNRDGSLKATAGAVCKLEYGFGEWSLKWVGC